MYNYYVINYYVNRTIIIFLEFERSFVSVQAQEPIGPRANQYLDHIGQPSPSRLRLRMPRPFDVPQFEVEENLLKSQSSLEHALRQSVEFRLGQNMIIFQHVVLPLSADLPLS